MSVWVLGARWCLAGVFALSGVAKLVDRAGTARTLVDFGVPKVLGLPGAVLLPIAELACAGALVAAGTAWWGATGVLVLLAIFTVAIGVNLGRGRTPDCHCFGQIRSEPIGATTLMRNAVLAALAGTVLWFRPGKVEPSMRGLFAATGEAWPLLALLNASVSAVLAVALFHVLRQNGRMLLRLDAVEARLGSAESMSPEPSGLPVGTLAPTFSLPDLDGSTVTLEAMAEAGKRIVLVFSEPTCSACDEVLPHVARWQRVLGDRVSTLVISRGTVAENSRKRQEFELKTVLLQQNRETADAYRVEGTPSAVIVTDGKIASPLAAGLDAIRDLVDGATRIGRGEPPPAVRLPDLSGTLVDLSLPTGRPLVLLFWSPSCGYCQELLGEVKRWEQTASTEGTRLRVISSGSIETNIAQGFASEVLLDRKFEIGTAFGASGTPSAVTLDSEGLVASDLGIGVDGVRGILRLAKP